MKQWAWIDSRAIRLIHDEQLAEHGGSAGLRSEARLESALGRPQNLAAYGKPAAAALAASYAVGLAKNHAFVDGNKRIAFVAMELFLVLNGVELRADDVSCVTTMLAVAAGEMDEAELAVWIRASVTKR